MTSISDFVNLVRACGKMRLLGFQPIRPRTLKSGWKSAPLDLIVAFLQLAAAGAFCVLCDCLALTLRGLANHPSVETEFIPPHIPALVDAHFRSPFFGGLPPFFA